MLLPQTVFWSGHLAGRTGRSTRCWWVALLIKVDSDEFSTAMLPFPVWLVPIVRGECRRLAYRARTMREVLHISLCAPDLMKSHWMLICHESCALTVCLNNGNLLAPAWPGLAMRPQRVEWRGVEWERRGSKDARSHFYLHNTTLVRWSSSYCFYWTTLKKGLDSLSKYQAILIVISLYCALTALLYNVILHVSCGLC